MIIFTNSGGSDNRPAPPPRLREFNPHHEPAGSPKGGQFARKGDTSLYTPVNKHGKDTQTQFKRADGTYTPERQALHERVIQKFLKGHKAQARPISVMLGGGPASGKSSVSREKPLAKDAVHVDVDEIRKFIPEYRYQIAKAKGRRNTAAEFSHEESSDISKLLIKAALQRRMNIVVDGTGDSTLESLTSKVALMRAGGRPVIAHYVTCDTETAVQRMVTRGRATGRFVPKSYLRNVHAVVSNILPRAMRSGLFDRVTLWDTNGGLRRVASSRGRRVTIHDPSAWKRFRAKAVKG